jgi:hypothetical protein
MGDTQALVTTVAASRANISVHHNNNANKLFTPLQHTVIYFHDYFNGFNNAILLFLQPLKMTTVIMMLNTGQYQEGLFSDTRRHSCNPVEVKAIWNVVVAGYFVKSIFDKTIFVHLYL